jgi:hypothetical protein
MLRNAQIHRAGAGDQAGGLGLGQRLGLVDKQDWHTRVDAVAEPGRGAQQEAIGFVAVELAAWKIHQRLLGSRADQDVEERGGEHDSPRGRGR